VRALRLTWAWSAQSSLTRQLRLATCPHARTNAGDVTSLYHVTCSAGSSVVVVTAHARRLTEPPTLLYLPCCPDNKGGCGARGRCAFTEEYWVTEADSLNTITRMISVCNARYNLPSLYYFKLYTAIHDIIIIIILICHRHVNDTRQIQRHL